MVTFFKSKWYKFLLSIGGSSLWQSHWKWLARTSLLFVRDSRRSENYTIERDPVVIASIMGNYNMMDRLLAANVRIFWTLHGKYPLVCSFESKEFKSTDEKLKFIDKYWGGRLGTEIKVFHFENDPYIYGMKMKDMQIIEYLVKKGVRPTETALDKAVRMTTWKWWKLFMSDVDWILQRLIWIWRAKCNQSNYWIHSDRWNVWSGIKDQQIGPIHFTK